MASEKNWKQKLEEDTGIKASETMFADWTWEKMRFIFREVWWEILEYAKDNDLELRNVVAITGKDTRKTTVWIIFLWFLMVQYPFLNGFLLRDTILKAKTQMKMQIRKGIGLINNEYAVEGFNEKAQETYDGFYLVRDKASKSNQKIELLSFDSIIELGGFTTSNGQPAIFIYDELQNPNSSTKTVITPNQFLANYKFLEEKNRAIEISTGNTLPKWIPRHIFLSNRYVGAHALNLFAEAHFKYYDYLTDENKIAKGVKSWMIEDPMNNNFICKYFGKEDMKEGWEDFWGTMIVYAGKLSNEILRKDKEWEAEQLKLIERGKPDDLARVIGDLFEGYDGNDKTYEYTRKDKITLKEFKSNYADHVDRVNIAIDVDFSRQITIGAKYYLSKQVGDHKIYRCVRDKIVKIKCEGKLSGDGAKTQMVLKRTYDTLLEYCVRIVDLIPHIQKVKLIFDDNYETIVGRFNFGDFKSAYWRAIKVDFKKKWNLTRRPKVIDEMQDTGFIVDLDEPSLIELHEAYSVSKKDGAKRMEKDNDPLIDLYNTDEYGVYDAKPLLALNNRSTRLMGGKNEW